MRIRKTNMLTSIKPSDFAATENKSQEMDYSEHGIEILPDPKTNAEIFHEAEKTEPKNTQESEIELLKEKTKKDMSIVSKNKVEILHNEPEKEGDE